MTNITQMTIQPKRLSTDLEIAEELLLSVALNVTDMDSSSLVSNLKYVADLISNARQVYEADRSN